MRGTPYADRSSTFAGRVRTTMKRPRASSLSTPQHPGFSRRFAIQAGAVGLLGLGMNHLAGAAGRRRGGRPRDRPGRPGRCIYIFLSGGLAQHDSFDLKPDAPDEIRGEFKPIATRTPGVQICEHLPLLAQRSHLWALVRSLTHPSNDHSAGHHDHAHRAVGRCPPGFNPNEPQADRLAVDRRRRRRR